MRSQFVTKTGVIAATVGSAVGLGNIWRFPYETGVHGGGAFLLLYVVCVALIGVPVMVAEFVMGRGTHKNAFGAFKEFAPRSVFRFVPYLGILASVLILSFYSVVAGWIMEYLYRSIVGLFSTSSVENFSEMFASFTMHPWRPSLWTIVFLSINYIVLRRGIEKGIERLSNILMPLLFIILVALCVNSVLLPSASQGLTFLFTPDFSQMKPSVVIGAMGQAFFSLSLGLTCLMTYSSYFSDSTPLVRTAVITAVLDLLVAVLAGVMIFPAVFSFGMEPQTGPKLVFETLPAIFAQMPGGTIWAVAFFVLLFFASITSTISMSEISISYLIEEHKLSRHHATALNTIVCMCLGVLCALSFGPLADFKIFGFTVFDLFDYVSSNICLPLGGIFISVFVGWYIDKRFLQAQITKGSWLPDIVVWTVRQCIRYLAPIAIIIIFVYGLL